MVSGDAKGVADPVEIAEAPKWRLSSGLKGVDLGVR